MPEPAKQQFNIYLPQPLIRSVKYRALDEQMSLSDFVQKALEQHLHSPQQQPAKESSMSTNPAVPVPQPITTQEVRLQPMLHVQDMAQAVRFFEIIGGKLAFGSRDGDWSLLRFGNTELSLLRHPPNTEQGDTEFELNFVSTLPLEEVEAHARLAGLNVLKPASDEFFGRQMILKLPSGMLVKINEIEKELVG